MPPIKPVNVEMHWHDSFVEKPDDSIVVLAWYKTRRITLLAYNKRRNMWFDADGWTVPEPNKWAYMVDPYGNEVKSMEM